MSQREGGPVRPAAEADAEAIVDLIAEYRSDHPGGSAIDRAPIRAAVSSALADVASTVLVATTDARVVGFVIVHWIPFPLIAGTEAYVSELVVAASCRGSGVGRSLMAAVEAAAVHRGCVRIMLNNVMAATSFQRGFYAKLGYRHREDVANFVKPLR